MIKYYDIPDQKKTVAVLENTAFDAINQITKVVGDTNSLCFNPSKYLMNSSYRAVVVCHPDDEYDAKEGRRRAKAKLLDHYYEQLDKKLDMFADDLTTAAFSMHNRLGYGIE